MADDDITWDAPKEDISWHDAEPAEQKPMGWGDVGGQALKNAPQSLYNLGHDIIQPVIHPIDTLSNLKNVGLGALEKTGAIGTIFPSAGGGHEQYADAVGKFFADRYGGMENIKRSIANDPAGVLGDLSAVLSGGETILPRLGKVGQIAAAGAHMANPTTWVAGAGRGASAGLKHLAGVESGVGVAPLEEAYKAGLAGGAPSRDFRENISGRAELSDAVDEARGAVSQLRQQRGADYRQSMSKTGKVGADTKVLDFNKIDNAVMKAEEVQTYSGRSGMGPQQSLSPSTKAIRDEMIDKIETWKGLDPAEFHSAEGIDALKKQLGDIRDNTQAGTPARTAADRIYNAVRQTIVDQVPEYAKIMKGYEEASKQIKEIERSLSLGDKATLDTALRKLQSTLRDNVNTSFGHRAKLAEFLANNGAPNMMAKLAGQALSPVAPRGLSRYVAADLFPRMAAMLGVGAAGGAAGGLGAAAMTAATLPLMSPRLVGETAFAAGKARRLTRPVTHAINASLQPSRQIGRAATRPFETPDSPFNP